MSPAEDRAPRLPARVRTDVTRVLAVASVLAASVAGAQVSRPSAYEPLDYSETAPRDPIAHLQERLASGEARLEFDAERGYLPSLLRNLDIPTSSQGLVFSRTSLQVDKIAPWTPRALYFNDDVYVGWVQNGPVVEIASVDPDLGAVFYTLAQDGERPPEFERQTTTCLMCHDSASITGGIPGFIVRSVFPDRYGYVIASVREGPTTDRTPLRERWGGWYVTGKGGVDRHAGNFLSPLLLSEIGNVKHYVQSTDVLAGSSLAELSERFDVSPYLTPGSDVVALLLLAHQATVHNLITRANYESRRALHDEELLLSSLGRGDGEHLAPTLQRIERATEPLVRGMLFVKEAALESLVQGTSGFAEAFGARGPRDGKGRSLRELDLERRLFRYPLSYLVYSESFDALPAPAKDFVYRRLIEVLTGEDESPEFAHLSATDRAAILEILKETKIDFAARFAD